MREYNRLFIDGRWQQPLGQGMAEVIDPASEAVAGKVPLGNEADVERAVQAARRAFADWSRTPSSVRAGYIRALVDQLKARADEMAGVITSELGMPVQWCRPVQVDGPIVGLEQYIALAGLMDDVREVGNSLVYREAVGRVRVHQPVELPAASADRQAGAGLGCRLYRGGQAQPGNAAACLCAGRDDRGHRLAGRGV
ncbi:aldehyde dehydrogenase family protein [Pseudomonas sichuanensis]|uniref:aldehyde dehydrogenase family protein n=1 Tax=Pseudomonas sichuanensis TaxID=2213015 RepID=UPI0035A685F8